ncbi:MAG: hypothetical protein J2P23_05755 [Microlunatus sp.]|nr:hypothetical protein [Microlunatus sp.]
MARRTRSVEQAYRRQKVIDRIVVGVLVLASAAGLMSVLPGTAQADVRRIGCRIGSLGLGACGEQVSTGSATPLGDPRCPELEQLDGYLPEVSATPFMLPDGLRGRLLRSRAGDITLDFGDLPTDPPDILDGRPRGTRQLLPGVTVPRNVEWWEPGGSGVDSLLQAVADAHRHYRQQRSALALFAALDNGHDEIPDPTVVYSSTRLDRATLPGPSPSSRVPKAARWVSIDPRTPAVISFNRVTQETSLIARISGSLNGSPTSGALRLTRDAAGRPSQILVAFATAEPPTPDQPALHEQTESVSYIQIPVSTNAERTLADRWLSSPGGFTLNLSPLLGWTAATARDQLNAWLSRAAQVTVLTWATDSPSADQAAAAASAQAVQELTTLRRSQQTTRLHRVTAIAPEPDGSRRVPVIDTQCVEK